MALTCFCFSSRCQRIFFFFFFNDTASTEIYTLSLHDALPISGRPVTFIVVCMLAVVPSPPCSDRKSTRLNSSHITISYAVFCLKKKKNIKSARRPRRRRRPGEASHGVSRTRLLGALVFFLMKRKPPRFTLFPYTTLFR